MVGSLAEKTVNTQFPDELQTGRLVFAHINYDLRENQKAVERFGASVSSLWIGTTVDGVFHKEENTNVWYKINDEADYQAYLTQILEKRLSGNLSE